MKLLLSNIILLLALGLNAQNLSFRQLTVKDGMPNNSVIALGEDSHGILWIATPSSLCKFDGESFVELPTDQLPDKRIDRINRDASGKMWVQCYEKHNIVSRYDTLTQQFITYNKSDLSDSLWHEAVKPLNRTFADRYSSRVWYIEKRLLWQKDTTDMQSAFSYTGQTAIDAGLRDEIIFSLHLDSHGILWIGSANAGLFFVDTRHSNYKRLVCQQTLMTRATCRDHNATLWFATPTNLNALPDNSREFQHISYPYTDSIEGKRIRPIIEDSKNRLWIGTFDGLYLKDSNSDNFRKITFADKRLYNIYALCEDNKRRLWIGTEQGLYRTELNSVSLQPQLIDSTIIHIIDIFAGKGFYWVASTQGLYKITSSGKKQYYDKEAHTVVTDGQGHTWLGTDDGLYRVTENDIKLFSSPADGHIVKDMLCWRDFLWCCYDQGIFCINIYTGKITKLHTLYNEYFEGSASIDKRTGTLYFGGTQGIDCFNADSLDEQLREAPRQLWLDEHKVGLIMKQEASSAINGWLIAFGAFIIAVIAVILFRVKRKRTQQPKQEDTHAKPSIFITKATAIINAHMSDANFTAEQLAQEMAMSRSKLFSLMKQETGKAAMEFVRDIRLDFAVRQLEEGIPVAEIASACGFSDASSFRRSFVKKYGITPSQYRQNTNDSHSPNHEEE